jgi:hypothetical protein
MSAVNVTIAPELDENLANPQRTDARRLCCQGRITRIQARQNSYGTNDAQA